MFAGTMFLTDLQQQQAAAAVNAAAAAAVPAPAPTSPIQPAVDTAILTMQKDYIRQQM